MARHGDDRLKALYLELKEFAREETQWKFMADSSGLSVSSVQKIHNLGKPWPIDQAVGRLFAEAADLEIDSTRYMVGLVPLMNHSADAMGEALEVWSAAVSGGETAEIPEQYQQAVIELGDKLERVALLSQEDLESVIAVSAAYARIPLAARKF